VEFRPEAAIEDSHKSMKSRHLSEIMGVRRGIQLTKSGGHFRVGFSLIEPALQYGTHWSRFVCRVAPAARTRWRGFGPKENRYDLVHRLFARSMRRHRIFPCSLPDGTGPGEGSGLFGVSRRRSDLTNSSSASNS
jgi:hypothetical protein